MRRYKTILCFFTTVFAAALANAQGLVIDHRCTGLAKIPDQYIETAKQKYKIAFGHGQYGSQLISGMTALQKKNKLYSFDRDGGNGALSLWDGTPSGSLGSPDCFSWATRTSEMLGGDVKSKRNLVIWSWGGYLSRSSKEDILLYLELMSRLENQFPEVNFVYTTGHLDGTGPHGNLHKRNEQIREYCRNKGKILYDIADIESYDPSGKCFLDLYVRGNCDYRLKGVKHNWAEEWVLKNPGHDFVLPEKSVGTHALIPALKANAFWWMLASLAGWDSGIEKFRVAKAAEETSKKPDKTNIVNSGAVTVNGLFTGLWRFDKKSDFANWHDSGGTGGLTVSDKGGMLIPGDGTPAVAVLNRKLAVCEFEFKVTLLEGDQINWFVNSRYEKDEWRVSDGIAGIMKPRGYYLVVDGKVYKIPVAAGINPEDRTPYHVQIYINDGLLLWGVNGRVIAKVLVSKELAAQVGDVAIGGYKTKLLVSGVYISGKE